MPKTTRTSRAHLEQQLKAAIYAIDKLRMDLLVNHRMLTIAREERDEARMAVDGKWMEYRSVLLAERPILLPMVRWAMDMMEYGLEHDMTPERREFLACYGINLTAEPDGGPSMRHIRAILLAEAPRPK